MLGHYELNNMLNVVINKEFMYHLVYFTLFVGAFNPKLHMMKLSFYKLQPKLPKKTNSTNYALNVEMRENINVKNRFDGKQEPLLLKIVDGMTG